MWVAEAAGDGEAASGVEACVGVRLGVGERGDGESADEPFRCGFGLCGVRTVAGWSRCNLSRGRSERMESVNVASAEDGEDDARRCTSTTLLCGEEESGSKWT